MHHSCHSGKQMYCTVLVSINTLAFESHKKGRICISPSNNNIQHLIEETEQKIPEAVYFTSKTVVHRHRSLFFRGEKESEPRVTKHNININTQRGTTLLTSGKGIAVRGVKGHLSKKRPALLFCKNGFIYFIADRLEMARSISYHSQHSMN